ncbi:MAG: hypothetical protein ACK2UJ_23830 [Candidatus Promineifilaceae bacterium]|jgi:ABC-type multidrug transport system permease subunit
MMPVQEKTIEKSNAQEYEDLTTAGPVKLAWRSTWLDQRAFNAVNHDWRPLRRGLTVLAAAVAIAAISRLLGTGLGILTSPRIDVLQEQILNALSGTTYFATLAAQSPDFAAQFEAGYAALWELIRLLGGYPSYAGLGGALIGLLFTFGSWITYATLAFMVGRWLGADASYGRTLGVFALAYTPVMLTVIKAVPGAYVASSLIFLLILVAKFLAAREVFELGPGGGLAAILLPYLMGLILLIGLLIFAAALGLNQVPYLDDVLRTLQFTGRIP